MTGGLLFDGNGRAEPFDVIHIGLFHRQELAGIGGERLHVAALAFCIEGVERQRTPEPDRPVITTSLSGISRSTFFRLWVRAPRTRMVSIYCP